MAIDEEIYNALNSQLGFGPDPEDDISATFKPMAGEKIYLYFGKRDDDGGPYLGFWLSEEVSESMRENLAVELHNVAMSKYASDVYNSGEDEWVYCSLTEAGGLLNWCIETMKELERRVKFTLNN